MKFFIISDCHGNYDGLMRALEKKGIVDSNGKRLLPRNNCQIISIGDLANCVDDSIQGDLNCLSLVGNVIDTMVIGNHEIPYLDERNTFVGFHFNPEINEQIQTLLDEDLIGGSVQIENTLITHAGLSRNMLSVQMSASECHDVIEYHFEARNWNHGFFSSIGRHRGGRDNVGGILWCDFDEEFIPTDFPQIVGHTPKYVRMKGNTLCIDVGAKREDTEPFILEIS
jgi:hypothetical protein